MTGQTHDSSVTANIVDHLLSIRDIPADVDELSRLHLLDSVGIAIAASALGPARDLPGSGRWASGPCSILSTATPDGVADTAAALVNGTLMHSLEYDDTHTGSVMHGSSVLAATILATAQERRDTADLVRAFTLGWEVLIRLGMAAPNAFQRVGFQTTPVAGPIAGTLAAGVMEGLTREQLIDAVGVAASFSAGNFTFLSSGATIKAAQAGIAAQGALSAVKLVLGGVTGSAHALEGERGLFGLYAREPQASQRFAALSSDLGDRWHLRDAAFKALPCCHFLHPFVEAVRDLEVNANESGPHGTPAQLRCFVPTGQETVIALPWESKQAPERAGEGRWSLPYVVALQAVNGTVEFDDFVGTPDPEVLRFAQKVEWEKWDGTDYPTKFPAKVEVEWSDGTVHTRTIDDVDGNASRPWGPERVVAKFRDNCNRARISAPEVELVRAGILDGVQVSLDPLERIGSGVH